MEVEQVVCRAGSGGKSIIGTIKKIRPGGNLIDVQIGESELTLHATELESCVITYEEAAGIEADRMLRERRYERRMERRRQRHISRLTAILQGAGVERMEVMGNELGAFIFTPNGFAEWLTNQEEQFANV